MKKMKRMKDKKVPRARIVIKKIVSPLRSLCFLNTLIRK